MGGLPCELTMCFFPTRINVIWVFAFNPALFEWWWRLFHYPHASWVAIILYNYYKRRRVHDLQSTIHGPFQGGVLKATTTFTSGIQIEVGNGRSTRFWVNHWVSDDTIASKFPELIWACLGWIYNAG